MFNKFTIFKRGVSYTHNTYGKVGAPGDKSLLAFMPPFLSNEQHRCRILVAAEGQLVSQPTHQNKNKGKKKKLNSTTTKQNKNLKF